ncbi:unnamed protein product, partial [Mesorhabditis spiculigera]
MLLRLLAVLLFCIYLSAGVLAEEIEEEDGSNPKNYKDFKLIRINPESEDSLSYLRALYEGESPYSLDFWQPPTRVGALFIV